MAWAVAHSDDILNKQTASYYKHIAGLNCGCIHYFSLSVCCWSLSLSNIDMCWPFWTFFLLSLPPSASPPLPPLTPLKSQPSTFSPLSPFPLALLYWHVDLFAPSSSCFPHPTIPPPLCLILLPLSLPPLLHHSLHPHTFFQCVGISYCSSSHSLEHPCPLPPLPPPPSYWLVHLIVLSPIHMKLTFGLGNDSKTLSACLCVRVDLCVFVLISMCMHLCVCVCVCVCMCWPLQAECQPGFWCCLSVRLLDRKQFSSQTGSSNSSYDWQREASCNLMSLSLPVYPRIQVHARTTDRSRVVRMYKQFKRISHFHQVFGELIY